MSGASDGKSKSELARELGVSRASLYYRRKVPEKVEELRLRIEEVMSKNPGYGYRRVALALKINPKRAKRVMKKFILKPARRAKAPRKPQDVGRTQAPYPDILAKICPLEPDLVWASDFTFISFKGTWFFLVTVLDVFSGVPLGFNISRTHDAAFVKEAIRRAIRVAGRLPEWFHSDQGSEYDSYEIASWLEAQKVKVSMSSKASPWRNGSQESFFGRFKVEFGDPDRFETTADFLEALFEHLHYFAHHRIKNRLKMPPAEFRELWFLNTSTGSPQLTSLPPGAPPLRRFAALSLLLLLFE